MDKIKIRKTDKILKGEIQLPFSKSESNRLLIIQSLCDGEFSIKNLSDADDTVLLKKNLEKIKTYGKPDIPKIIDTKNAGTIMRFLTAFLSNNPGKWILTGSERMKERPVGILVNVLRQLGAKIEYADKEAYPPLKISGTKLEGGEISVDASISSQYISALLMIAPMLPQGLTLELQGSISSMPYIKMTMEIMKFFGIKISDNKNIIKIKNQQYIARDFSVEADWSAASYWYEMTAFSDEVDLTLKGLKIKSLQGDAVIADVFKKFGVQTKFIPEGVHLSKTGKFVKKLYFDFNNYPDIALAVIVSCAGLNINGKFKGLKNLKIKETDRILALKTELKKAGCNFEETSKSGWELKNISEIQEPSSLQFSTYNDHRMAMSFAPLVIKYGEIEIENPGVVKKSYPGFWDDLKTIGFEICCIDFDADPYGQV